MIRMTLKYRDTVLIAKFTQDEYCKRMLLNTGLNHLGRLLVEVRQEITNIHKYVRKESNHRAIFPFI